jgi:holo-[acyl-carrier protein] synthase
MVISIGIDIVELKRISRALKTYKSRFREKYFTYREIEYCSSKVKPSQHYAARFAAKEAAFKSLGKPWPPGCGYIDVEVITSTDGAPELRFSDALQKAFDELGMKKAHLSITHTKISAAAVVIIEG